MNMNKRFLSLALAFVMVLGSLASLTPVLAADTAVDLSDIDGHWAEAQIKRAVKEGLVEGYEDGTFKPQNTLTRGEMATILSRAFDLEVEADLKDFTDVKSNDWFFSAMGKAVEAGIFKGDGNKLMPKENIRRDHAFATVARGLEIEEAEEFNKAFPDLDKMDNSVKGEVAALVNLGIVEGDEAGNLNPAATITRAEMTKIVNLALGFEVEDDEEAKDLKIESVSAINAKTVKVTFNKGVSEANQAKATVELLKGTFKQNVTVNWAEDMKSVHLVGANNFQAGEYTVNVEGLTEEALTGTVTIEAQKIETIEILDEVAVVDKAVGTDGVFPAETKATVSYIVKDQYGVDITKTTDLKTNDDTTIKAVKAKGVVELSGSAVAGKKIDDIVAVVLIDSKTGASTSKTVKLSAESAVSEMEVAGIYNAKGEEVTLNDKSKATDGVIVLNLKDQYGKEITEVAKAAGLVITNTNNTILELKETDNKTVVESMKIDGKDKLVVKLEKIEKAGKVDILFISTTNGKSIKYTVTVEETTTTDEISVSQPEIAVAGEDILIPITVMDKAGNVITDKKILANSADKKGIKVGSNYVKESELEVKNGQVYYKKQLAEGTQALVFQTSTFKVATITLDVKAAKIPTVVRGLKDPLVISTAKGEVKITAKEHLVIEDQYGRAIKDADYAVEVELVDEDSKVISLVGNTIKGLKNGTDKLKIKLVTENDKIDSAVEVTVRVTDGKEYTGYEIAPIGKVQAGENKEYTVNGLLDGGKVALQASEYTATLNAGTTEVDATNGNFTVKSTNLKTDKDGDPIDTEFTLKVTINATGKVLEEKFTVSKDEAKTATFFFTNSATDVEYKDAKEIKDAVVKGLNYNIKSMITVNDKKVSLNIATVDQYNNKDVKAIDAREVNVTITPAKAADVTITDNGKGNAMAVLAKDVEEAKLTVKVKVGNATEELAVTLVRSGEVTPPPVVEKADLTAYNEALVAVKEVDYTEISWTAYQAIVSGNIVTENNTQDQVNAAVEAITAAQTNLVKVENIDLITEVAITPVSIAGKISIEANVKEGFKFADLAIHQNGNLLEIVESSSSVEIVDGKLSIVIDTDGTANEVKVEYDGIVIKERTMNIY